MNKIFMLPKIAGRLCVSLSLLALLTSGAAFVPTVHAQWVDVSVTVYAAPELSLPPLPGYPFYSGWPYVHATPSPALVTTEQDMGLLFYYLMSGPRPMPHYETLYWNWLGL